jgi:hypothetical protein
MECKGVDDMKPLDKLLDDQIREFDSGEDKACDKDLDMMIWELGAYENEASRQEAEEFAEAQPLEEELVEKRIIRGKRGQPSFIEGRVEAELLSGEEVTTAHSLTPVVRRRRAANVGANLHRKRKSDRPRALRP